jgi:hypothetical protein
MDVQAGDSVEFRLASQDFNPFLIVADIDGQPLQVAGTLGDSVASMGMLAAFDETWLVVANVLLPNDYGDYRLVTTDVSVATTSLQRVPSGERATLRGEDGSDWAASESSAHSLGGVFGSPDGAAAIKKLKGIE